MLIEMFHVSVIAQNAAMVICGIVFGGMRPSIADGSVYLSNEDGRLRVWQQGWTIHRLSYS